MQEVIKELKELVGDHEKRISRIEAVMTKLTEGGKKPRGKEKPGPLAWLQELVDEGFFSEPKSSKDILEELSNRSHRLKPSDLTRPLQNLCHERKLPLMVGKKYFVGSIGNL